VWLLTLLFPNEIGGHRDEICEQDPLAGFLFEQAQLWRTSVEFSRIKPDIEFRAWRCQIVTQIEGCFVSGGRGKKKDQVGANERSARCTIQLQNVMQM